MVIAVGAMVPSATLARMGEDGPIKVETGDFFSGRRIALFCVPGAFTPTCSVRHLPGFVDKAAEFKANGIDEIAAVSVNDVFVMDAWGRSAGVGDSVTMLADGNGDFVRALGLDFDASGFGMGVRGKRFAMIVDDGRVEKLYVEAPGEFRVSSADYLLGEI